MAKGSTPQLTSGQILSERLSMHFVKQGQVIFEEGTIGSRMYFVRSGAI
jgi:CRP-like cAMP-binding protein